MSTSKICCFHVFFLLMMVSLKVDGQYNAILLRRNPWASYGRGSRVLQPIPIPRVLKCSDVVCPDPRTRCVDAGGADQPKCVDPCQGGLLRGIRGCTRMYAPLCGTDGVVYSNSCYLEHAMCLDRTLDVCVVAAGFECKDRHCSSTDRNGTPNSSALQEASVGPRSNYRDGYRRSAFESRVGASYLVRNQH